MNRYDVIQMLKEQDPLGIDALLREYGPLMRYIIGPILRDPREQEECLSDVTMRVWNNIHTFDPARGSWTTWLTAITRNAALNCARKLAPHHDIQGLPSSHPTSEIGPEEALLATERAEQLRRVIDHLSAADRRLFYRKYYYLQPIAQIAAEMGLSERAIEGRLYRLKRRLRTQLEGDDHV